MRRFVLLLLATALLPDSARPLLAAELSSAATTLAEYLRFDTTNPPGGERAAAEFLAHRLRAAGVEARILVSPGGRANLFARLPATRPPKSAEEGPLVLLHHLDVVPAGEGWSRSPFGGELHEGAIWGRGAIDAKGLGVAHLAALLDLARSGEPRRRDLILLAVADEEAGGGEGTNWILEAFPQLFAGTVAVLNEGGVNRSVAGRTLYWGIEVDQKRPLWLEVATSGRAGHASVANPESATHRLVQGLARLVATPRPWRATASARSFLSALARFDPQARLASFALDRLAASPGGPPPSPVAVYESLLSDTLQVTTLAGSSRINVVAGEARAGIDLRLLPDADATETVAWISKTLGAGFEVRTLLSSPAAPASSHQTPMYAALATSLAGDSGAPVVPAFIPAFTDSRWFRARGIPAYGLSPFALDAVELRTVHAPDERISLVTFDRGVQTMTRIVRALVSERNRQP